MMHASKLVSIDENLQHMRPQLKKFAAGKLSSDQIEAVLYSCFIAVARDNANAAYDDACYMLGSKLLRVSRDMLGEAIPFENKLYSQWFRQWAEEHKSEK
jgi:hypothetical protein